MPPLSRTRTKTDKSARHAYPFHRYRRYINKIRQLLECFLCKPVQTGIREPLDSARNLFGNALRRGSRVISQISPRNMQAIAYLARMQRGGGSLRENISSPSVLIESAILIASCWKPRSRVSVKLSARSRHVWLADPLGERDLTEKITDSDRARLHRAEIYRLAAGCKRSESSN